MKIALAVSLAIKPQDLCSDTDLRPMADLASIPAADAALSNGK